MEEIRTKSVQIIDWFLNTRLWVFNGYACSFYSHTSITWEFSSTQAHQACLSFPARNTRRIVAARRNSFQKWHAATSSGQAFIEDDALLSPRRFNKKKEIMICVNNFNFTALFWCCGNFNIEFSPHFFYFEYFTFPALFSHLKNFNLNFTALFQYCGTFNIEFSCIFL